MISAGIKEVNRMTQQDIRKALEKQFQQLSEHSEWAPTDADLASISCAMCEIAWFLQEPVPLFRDINQDKSKDTGEEVPRRTGSGVGA